LERFDIEGERIPDVPCRTVHVGLNLVYLVPGYTGGTEVVARELLPALVAAAGDDVRFTAFINREAAEAPDGPWKELMPAVMVPVRARNRVEWVRGEQQHLPRLAAAAGVDVVHSLANTAPAWGRFRRVVTVHDLIHRFYPDTHGGLKAKGMQVLVPLAIRRSHRVMADSAATAGDLERELHVPADKVDVVPMGVGTTARATPEPADALRARHALGDRPIVLTVAAKRPHKNLPRLIEAIALIEPPRRPLLVAPGYGTFHDDELAALVDRLAVAEDVRLLGWVSDAELEGLYAAAALFVLPSLYEGFGLPVLEAMARGVPVACSDRGSLREVAGGAARVFDPERPDDIARAIAEVLADSAQADRLRAAGRDQAARFTWQRSAELTLASYRRASA
jgi:glycosyltransferase involved in cell wall biosynthesis